MSSDSQVFGLFRLHLWSAGPLNLDSTARAAAHAAPQTTHPNPATRLLSGKRASQALPDSKLTREDVF
eukprot:963486-Alexandrium_andersonii.AAC.1